MRRTQRLNDFFTDEDADLDGPLADRNRSADELAEFEGRAIGVVAMVPTLTDGVIILNRHTDDDIADHVAGEDEETVANHISSIFAKLQVAGRAEAIIKARDAGFGRA